MFQKNTKNEILNQKRVNSPNFKLFFKQKTKRMDLKKFSLGTLAGGVAFFVLGFLIYGVALADFMASNAGTATGVTKEPMEMWALILGNLAYAALLTYIFMQWANISTFATGAKAGAIIGLLVAVYFDFLTYSMMNLSNMTGLIVDIVVFTIISALVGGVVGLALGKIK